MPFHPQKCFTPILGENTKRVLKNNCSKFFEKSFLIFPGYRRRYVAMQNISIEKREKEEREKGQIVLEKKRIKR